MLGYRMPAKNRIPQAELLDQLLITQVFGADGFTDELHAGLKDAGVERVLIAFDRDEAGEREVIVRGAGSSSCG